MKLLLTSLLLTLSISAANLSGKWTGTFIDASESNKSEGAVVILTQDGNTLTGTAGPTADEQMPISNGKVDGNNVTFDVKTGDVTIHFSLQLVDKHLKGKAAGEANGESKSATVDLTRAE
jgi:hypothetical protein